MATPSISLNKPALSAGIEEYAQMFNQLAVESKPVALKLMADGIRTDFTPGVLMEQLPDVFAKDGKLINASKEELSNGLKKFKLPQDITLSRLEKFLHKMQIFIH